MPKRIKNISLGEPRRITAGLTNHEHPSVAPGGKLIAYYAGPYENIHVYVTDLTGRLSRALSHGAGNNTQPAWSPDGAHVAFRHQDSSKAKWEIWVAKISEDGMPKPLLVDKHWHFKHPCYSPDGKQITYFSDEGSADVFHIWSLELKSGERHQLSFGGSQNHSHPVFSPDGSRIIYHSYEGSEMAEPAVTNIYELDVEGGDIRAYTTGTDQYKHPFYVNEDLITYHHEDNSTGVRRLCAMQLSAAQEFELTDGSHNDKHAFPYLDEDGKTALAFASKKLGPKLPGEEKTYDIFTAQLRIED